MPLLFVLYPKEGKQEDGGSGGGQVESRKAWAEEG